jgi:hypothetical protein
MIQNLNYPATYLERPARPPKGNLPGPLASPTRLSPRVDPVAART